MAAVATAGLSLRSGRHDHSGARLAEEEVPRALRAFWTDGLFAAAQDAFILAYLPLLAAELGASAIQIGLLSASQSLGAMVAFYPGAIVGRRGTSRRWMVVFYAGILGRLMLLLTALTALTALTVAFAGGQVALYLVITLMTVRAFLSNFVAPAWTSLAADIIPPGFRARYMASRNFAINLALLTVTPLGGLLLDWMGFPGGYVAALLASFALGMCATVAYARIPEPPARPRPARPVRSNPAAVLCDGNFRLFLLATFSLQFATMIAGPFFNVYLKENLRASNFEVGWLTTASAVAGIVGQLYFGDLMARRGGLWLTRMSLIILPALPILWAFLTRPWMVLAPNLLGGCMWAAFNLANFQLLLEFTKEEDREEYVAVFQTCVFAALFLAPFAGGLIIEHMGYRAAFTISGTGRIVSTLLFFFAVRPASTTPTARVLEPVLAEAAASLASGR
jgi:MFS family permease